MTDQTLAEELAETLEFISPTGALSFLKRRGPALVATIKALQYGFDLYGYDGPDGPWPIEKRREFDRLARAALQGGGE